MRKYFLIICLILVLTGCSKDKTEIEDNTMDSVGSEDNGSLKEAERVIEFKGISSKVSSPKLGNLAGWLHYSGYICRYNETLFYRDINGSDYLYREEKNGEKTRIIDKKVLSINVLGDYIYFISEDDNNAICRTNIDGEDYTILNEDTSYLLLVSKDCIFYTNKEGNLYQLSPDGKEAKLISDDNCAWPNTYRDYIIYSSFADEFKLVGVNINTGERIQIADYGFSPVVYEDTLYFQGKDGNIKAMDLRTGESIDYINEWGQMINPTKEGLYFSNATDIFYYESPSKELRTIHIVSPDPGHEINQYTIVELLYCDKNSIYYIIKTGDKRDLVYVDVETGEAHKR